MSFKWNIASDKDGKGEIPSFFEDGDILVPADDMMGVQYIMMNGKAIPLSNDAQIMNDYFPEDIEKKLFKKNGASNSNMFDKVELLKSKNKDGLLHLESTFGIYENDLNKLKELNKSSDLETLTLVSNIIKTKYHVDIQ